MVGDLRIELSVLCSQGRWITGFLVPVKLSDVKELEPASGLEPQVSAFGGPRSLLLSYAGIWYGRADSNSDSRFRKPKSFPIGRWPHELGRRARFERALTGSQPAF
jgi:hypothetical protein